MTTNNGTIETEAPVEAKRTPVATPAPATRGRQLKGKAPKDVVPGKPKIVIFGKPGVGKTWTSLDFPSVYYIDTEGGADLQHYQSKLEKSGGLYMGPKEGALDFEKVIEEVMTLATIQHGFRTLVIDSFTKLFSTRMSESEQELIKKGHKIEFSVEKKDPTRKTRRLVAWLSKLDMNVILICHEKDKWENGEVIGQTLDGWDKLEYELHLCMRIMKNGNTRTAKVTKSRLLGFPDADSFPWSYDEFAKRYGRDIMESEAQAIQLATEAQIEEVTKLIDVLKYPVDEVTTWFEKAGIEKWSDMPAENIVKCIGFLRSKITV